MVLVVLAAATAGGAATIGALVGDTERIGEYWTHAEIGRGQSRVIEVIDYDFGPRQRRGILRNIPGVPDTAPIQVSSPTAPDDVRQTGWAEEVDLRIGNPDIDISGRHRYVIEYPIATLVEDRRMSWNAVGTDWDIPINNVEVHVTAPFELLDIDCDQGSRSTQGGCTAEVVAPGHIVVETGGLSDREAVTVSATLGAPLAQAPAAPVPPIGPADDPGSGWLMPGLTGLAAALGMGALTSRGVRNLGREQVWEGGAADAAFGPRSGEFVGIQLMDQDDLASMATIEFEPPRDLSASAGGIILSERVTPQHQIAWLIEAAIRDEVEIEENPNDKKKMTLRRGPAEPHPVVAERLADLLGTSDEVVLGKYDERFAKAWSRLGNDLEQWRESSGLWDPAGASRKRRARVWGTLAALVGLGIAFGGGVLANRLGIAFVAVCVAGAGLAGFGLAALIRSWELDVRTAEGSGTWLRVESFRRFIEASEARHAEAAAQRGLLRHYTAWAVALGELSHWNRMVDAAAEVPGSSVTYSSGDLAFVAMAPTLSRATAQTFTAPSSSGGGGGGGAGGGGGGGGGGSW